MRRIRRGFHAFAQVLGGGAGRGECAINIPEQQRPVLLKRSEEVFNARSERQQAACFV